VGEKSWDERVRPVSLVCALRDAHDSGVSAGSASGDRGGNTERGRKDEEPGRSSDLPGRQQSRADRHGSGPMIHCLHIVARLRPRLHDLSTASARQPRSTPAQMPTTA
jgi:hypothetical protein